MSLFGRIPGHNTITGNLRAQFGLGISLGLMIGIVPKDSLLPWAIGLFTLLLPRQSWRNASRHCNWFGAKRINGRIGS